MARSRVCPGCGGLNGPTERRCYQCDRPLPGPLQQAVTRQLMAVLGEEAPATRALAILCGLVFVAMVAEVGTLPLGFGFGSMPLWVMLKYGALSPLPSAPQVSLGLVEPWRYLSATVVHFSVLHVGMNGWVLTSVGREVEASLGSGRLVLLYVVTGVVGFLASDLASDLMGGGYPVTAGASGAVFGLFGARIGELAAARRRDWRRVAVNYLVFAVLLGLALPVNTAAHLGGFAAGIAAGRGLAAERNPERWRSVLAILTALCFLAAVASVALSVASPYWEPVRPIE